MTCFLTSRTDIPATGALNPANGFIDALRRRFPAACRALFVCSDPEGWEKTDFYSALIKKSFEDAGFSFQSFTPLDGRNEGRAAELTAEAELLILSGGHVPTQNRFFRRIGLKALLEGFGGVVVGISAGSMNSAETVYACPEEEGEAADPAYERFLPGLGLTKTMILPHWQFVREETLDGLRILEDIVRPDSRGRRFLLLPDGSWLLREGGRETVFGEAWLLEDGTQTRICSAGGSAAL